LKFGAALWHFSDMAFLFGDVRSKGDGSTGASGNYLLFPGISHFRATADYIGGKALAV
jgi:hypothetical protein